MLKGYYRKQLNSRDNDPWEVMHGMLAYGVHSRIRQGGPRGEPITSVGWLCYNKPCKGQTLMYVTPQGEVRAKYGVGLQGHLGQLLAMLAQCHVSADYPIHVGKHEFTIHDLIEAEKKTCYPKSELTFKLIALQHYLDLNDTWVNDQGVEWDYSAADARRIGPADSRRGLRRHAPAFGPEPGRESPACAAASRSTANTRGRPSSSRSTSSTRSGCRIATAA